ncbi:unnamed protein product [Chrysoparadoxa australica]
MGRRLVLGLLAFQGWGLGALAFSAMSSLSCPSLSHLCTMKASASVAAGQVRTKELWRSAREGDIRKREFASALAKRVITKGASLQRSFRVNNEAMAKEAEVKVDASDVSSIEASWSSRGYGSALTRNVEIWAFAVRMLLKELKARKKLKTDPALGSEMRAQVAIQLRQGLLKLGPTFIKLGQLLSTRIDVVPKEYINELVKLQDEVPGFSGEMAQQIIEEELGQPVSELFGSFDANPLAAASLGQVHKATMRGSGTELAVKVQRQGLKELFDKDLLNLKKLVQLLDKLDPKADGADRDWIRIYEESAKLLYKEIDYVNEAENAQDFRDNFSNNPWVKVPDVYFNMTTEKVIVMEYVPGIKVNNIEAIEKAGIDRKLLAKRSAEAYLTQLCRHGLFHCDPHPGNVACDAAEGGRLIFYDFGMMDSFRPNVRSGLVNLIFAIYENEPVLCCDALEEMGILQPGADRISVERVARSFLGEFTNTITKGTKWTSELDREEQKQLRKERRAQLGEGTRWLYLLSVGNDVPFLFPPTFSFVFRAFTSLDGIGKGLDPQYDLTRLAQPFLKELLDLRDGSVAVSFIKGFAKKVGWRPEDIAALVQSPRKVDKVEKFTRKLEQGDLKLRVRVLEAERAFQRMDLVQSNMNNVLAFSCFFNAALLLTQASNPLTLSAKGLWAAAALFGLQIPIGVLKIRSEDKKLKKYGVK